MQHAPSTVGSLLKKRSCNFLPSLCIVFLGAIISVNDITCVQEFLPDTVTAFVRTAGYGRVIRLQGGIDFSLINKAACTISA